MLRSSLRLVLVCLLFSVSAVSHADGIQDNIAENVRRIPVLGVPVPDDRAASMRTALGQLQEKLAAINAATDANAK